MRGRGCGPLHGTVLRGKRVETSDIFVLYLCIFTCPASQWLIAEALINEDSGTTFFPAPALAFSEGRETPRSKPDQYRVTSSSVFLCVEQRAEVISSQFSSIRDVRLRTQPPALITVETEHQTREFNV